MCKNSDIIAANEYVNKKYPNSLNEQENGRTDFLAGVKFAQQWTQVQDQLPPKNVCVFIKYTLLYEHDMDDACHYETYGYGHLDYREKWVIKDPDFGDPDYTFNVIEWIHIPNKDE